MFPSGRRRPQTRGRPLRLTSQEVCAKNKKHPITTDSQGIGILIPTPHNKTKAINTQPLDNTCYRGLGTLWKKLVQTGIALQARFSGTTVEQGNRNRQQSDWTVRIKNRNSMFPPSRNNEDDEPMMICDYDAVPSSHETTTCFERSNSLGNDFCPHSSQLFPLMEADEELPIVSSSIRKQTAVTCLSALAQSTDFEDSNNSSHSDFTPRAVFGRLVAEEGPEDEWGQFAHHEAEFARSTRPLRLPSRRRPHQRRRSTAKYDRHGTSVPTTAWRG